MIQQILTHLFVALVAAFFTNRLMVSREKRRANEDARDQKRKSQEDVERVLRSVLAELQGFWNRRASSAAQVTGARLLERIRPIDGPAHDLIEYLQGIYGDVLAHVEHHGSADVVGFSGGVSAKSGMLASWARCEKEIEEAIQQLNEYFRDPKDPSR